MANQKDGNEEISDERAADWFGWTVRTARRHRQALLKTGWVLVEKTSGKTYTNFTYFLGKDAVADRRPAAL